MKEEIFDIVTKEGKVIGQAKRSEVHGNPQLIHRTVHCLVFNSAGMLYLQKRAETKDVQPGKWDTSVGGHLCPGESIQEGIKRESLEELGIRNAAFEHLYTYLMSNEIETELVDTFKIIYDDLITFDQAEISEGRFWTPEAIDRSLTSGLFTPNFVEEWGRYKTLSQSRSTDPKPNGDKS